jgi:hypothetical protein
VNERQVKRTLCWTWLAGAAVLGVFATMQTMRDTDTWWHIALGREILAHGFPHDEPFAFTPAALHPWMAHEWGYEVILAKLVSYNPVFAAVLTALMSTTAFLIAVRSIPAETDVPPQWPALAYLVTVYAAGTVLGIRAQITNVLGVAIVMYVIARWRRGPTRIIWVLPAVFLVWANMHAGFIIGVVLIGVALLLPRGESWNVHGPRRPLIAVLVACCAVSLINPFGFHIFTYLADTITNPSITNATDEFLSPDFHTTYMRIVEVVTVGLVGAWILTPGGPDLADVVFAGGAFAAMLEAQRNISLYQVIIAPQVARYGHLAWEAHRRRIIGGFRFRPMPPALAVPAGLLITAALSVAVVVTIAPGMADLANGSYEATARPEGAVSYIIRAHPGQRIYASYSDGGYLAYRIPAGRVVMIYPESTVFGNDNIQNFLAIAAVRPNWTQVLDDTGVRVALLARDDRLFPALYAIGWNADCYDEQSDYVVMSRGASISPSAGPVPDPATLPSCETSGR